MHWKGHGAREARRIDSMMYICPRPVKRPFCTFQCLFSGPTTPKLQAPFGDLITDLVLMFGRQRIGRQRAGESTGVQRPACFVCCNDRADHSATSVPSQKPASIYFRWRG